jgi:large subunit ribosomal protein L10
LPSREELLATLLSALNGVPTSFVRTLGEIPKQFLYILQAIKEQKEAV